MNVTCTGCPAKYAVPDEKVRGKKVRITCKHCGTNIVVDGNALGADPSAVAKPSVEAKPAPAAEEAAYVVGFADDRQETHTVSEIVTLYSAGKLDEESLVWKDGMADWLSPFDVPEIAAAFRKAGVARRPAIGSLPLSSPSDDEPTVVGRSPFDADALFGDAPKHDLDFAPEPAKPAAALRQSSPELKPAAVPVAAALRPAAGKPAAAAARRSEKSGGAIDLFGAVADAGSEADASLDLAPPQEAEHKLTGARNESSVLFSLDALTKPDPKALGQKKARDQEQEKQASAALFGDSAPNSLANMGGGGFSALAAPDFTRPVAATPEPQVRPSDPVEVPNAAPVKKKGAAVWVIAVLGLAAAAGVAFFVMQKKSALDKAPAASAPDTKAAAAPVAAAPIPTAATADAPASGSAEAPSTSPVESVAQAITAAGSKPPATAAATPTAAGTASKPAEKPAETKKPDAPAAAVAAAPAAAADGAAFDKGAAVSALGAAAANAGSCKKPDGPTGSGKVSVTFAPSGRATMTNVGGAFAGTEVGGCVARLFRAAKVPPFSGDPVTVSKSFSIE